MRDVPFLQLRQYLLRPGRREDLVALFDRELAAPQEAEGMYVVGRFRDLDRPDHFVRLRGFPDLATRANRLRAFYGGPVWRAHRDAADATMIDWDDVLLLGAVPGHALPWPPPAAPQAGPLTITVHDALSSGPALGRYETEPAPNAFPRCPGARVRT